MKRVVSLFLPTWPTDRFVRNRRPQAPPAGASPDPAAAAPSSRKASARGQASERPLVLIGSDGRSKIIHAANVAARHLGISAGMPATQAQALVPGLETQLASPEEDALAPERLGLWIIRRYSPSVATDPPDGLMIDGSGIAHLFGGEAAMLEDLTDRLGSSGIAARAALASTRGAAHAAARWLSPRTSIIAPDATAAALASLPLNALRLDTDTVLQLKRLGFASIGELNATARAPLALRFGQSLLQRLDQAYGRLG